MSDEATPVFDTQITPEAKVPAEVKKSDPLPLLIMSRIRDLFHESEINVSDNFLEALNQYVVDSCVKIIARCKGNGRKTARPVDI